MELFEIIDIEQIKSDFGIKSFTLVDFTVGFDDTIYLLFSQKIPERIDGMFVNTKADTRYAACKIIWDWSANNACDMTFIDFGVLELNYHFIRPLRNDILLIGARCRYYSQNDIEQNILILEDKGEIRKLCFGDGINDCLTTPDGRIIVSYFDEGVFGNFGWDKPIGSSGLIVWDDSGNILWENKNYDIVDCYAINLDSGGRLWFYYYCDFDLVCTDFQTNRVIHPGIRGCDAFALSETQRKILFSGGHNDSSFYECEIDIFHSRIGGKQKVDLMIGDKRIKKPICHFCGSKLIFLVDGTLYGYNFV